jgi:TonB family protein
MLAVREALPLFLLIAFAVSAEEKSRKPLTQVPPNYPNAEQKAGIGGTAITLVTVDVTGQVLDVRIAESSRNRSLDLAAVSAVRQWVFEAGDTASTFLIPVEFIPPPQPEGALLFQDATSGSSAISIASLQLAAQLGHDHKPVVPTNLFKPTDSIYLVVTTSAPSEGVIGSVGAAWRYGVGEDEQAVHSEGKELLFSGPGTTTFEIRKPSGWPPGNYSVEVFLNGKTIKRLAYKVQ